MSKKDVVVRGLGSLALLAAVSGSLVGCVSTKTVGAPSEQLSKWQGKTVALTDRPRAGFAPMTAGKAMFGLIGAAAMIDSGKAIVAEHNIEDPTPQLARDLLAAGVEKYGVVPATTPPVKVDTGDVVQLAKAAAGADLLLDVQNVGFSWRYRPTDWGHYLVETSYKMRIVDVKQSALIAEGFCHHKAADETAKTKDELLADHAALLKQIVAQERDVCRDEFEKQVLAIGS